VAAGHAPRPRRAALGDERDGRVFEHLEIALDAVAAREGARSATVATEAVAAHAHRVGALERFDRRVEGVGHAGVDAAHAGEALHGAPSAAERLVVHPAVAADDHVV